jgi:hypothetical protein
MDNDKQPSPVESLALIQSMINNARSRATDDGLGWLLWGLMIFCASLTTYILILVKAGDIYTGWNVFGCIAIVWFAWKLLRPGKTKMVRTYIDDLLRLFDVGFMMCLLIIILSINIAVSPNEGFGYFLMIYAFLMLIQGGALQFRPLMLGAAVNAAGSVAIFINKDFKYDMLITAGSVLIGYIIPGLLLQVKHRRAVKTNSL